jgi:hypothetical protein
MLPLLITVSLWAAPDTPLSFKSPLGFTLSLPGDFVEHPEGERGPIKHLWLRQAGKPDFEQIAVQLYPGAIERSCPAADKLPPGVKPFTTRWDGLPVCGTRTEQRAADQTLLDLSVDVPLAPAAIAVHVAGWPKNEPALKARLVSLLGALSGKSTWRLQFGCFEVTVPQGWGLLNGSIPAKLELARNAPLAGETREYRPQFNIASLKAEIPVLVETAEANAVAEAKKVAKGEVATKRIELGGRPAAEVRYTQVDAKGMTLKNRIVVVPHNERVHVLSLGADEKFAAAVDPIADELLASARFTCQLP